MVTRPAPARSAPRAASRAAPVCDWSPDTTTAWPRGYLWPPGCGTGKCSGPERRRIGEDAAAGCSPAPPSGMPMSATSTGPQCSRPGSSRWPGFRRKNVTVSLALHRRAHHRAAVAVDAARQIDGDDRHAGRRSSPRSSPAPALDRPVEAGAEQRVDDQAGARQGRGRGRLDRALPARAPPRAASPLSRSRSPSSSSRTG